MTQPLTKKQVAFAWTVQQLVHAVQAITLDTGFSAKSILDLAERTEAAMACWRRAMNDEDAGPDADRTVNWLRYGHALIDQVIWWRSFGQERQIYLGALIQQSSFVGTFYRVALDEMNPAMRAGPGRAA